MKIAKALAITVTIVMFFTLVYGVSAGNFFEEGSLLFSMAWGKVTLIEVYIGFLLFSSWVVYREKKLIVAVLWILSLMVLGNFITGLYITITLFNSNEGLKQFWLGKHYLN